MRAHLRHVLGLAEPHWERIHSRAWAVRRLTPGHRRSERDRLLGGGGHRRATVVRARSSAIPEYLTWSTAFPAGSGTFSPSRDSMLSVDRIRNLAVTDEVPRVVAAPFDGQADFDAFYRAELDWARRLSFVMTGDRHSADDIAAGRIRSCLRALQPLGESAWLLARRDRKSEPTTPTHDRASEPAERRGRCRVRGSECRVDGGS